MESSLNDLDKGDDPIQYVYVSRTATSVYSFALTITVESREFGGPSHQHDAGMGHDLMP